MSHVGSDRPTEKASLIGEAIGVAPRSKYSKEPDLYWKVRRDIKPDASNTILEFNQIGVVSFHLIIE